MTAEARAEPADRPGDRGAGRLDVAVLGWGAAATAICACMALLEPSLLEEGLILHLAQRMADGEQLFVDLASFTGPLPFEVLALLFRVLGEEIALARAVVALLAGASCAAVFALVRRAGLGDWAHLAAACMAVGPVFFFPLHSVYFYSTLAYHLTLLSCYAGLRGRDSDGWAISAGVLAACVVLSKQSVGVLVAPGLVLAMLVVTPTGRSWRAGGLTALAGLAVAAGTTLYYAAQGALGAMVDSLIFLPLTFEEAFGSAFMNLWPPGEFSAALKGQAHFYTPFVYSILRGVVVEAPSAAITLLTQVLYGLPFLALAATGLRRLQGTLHPAIWFHAVALLALIANLFPRTDWGHLVFCAAPAFVQLLLLCPPSRAGFALRRAMAGTAGVALLAGALMLGTALWQLSEPPDLGSKVPLRRVSSQYRDPALSRVVAHLRDKAKPGEAIFVARAEPLIYFATGTRNPTRYSGVIPGMLELQQQEILAALEDVRFVVMSEIDQPVFTIYRDLLPEVEAYLERHFRLPSEFQGSRYGWIVVFERAEDRGPTAIDLFEGRARASRWLVDDFGELQPDSLELPLLATSHNRRPVPMWMGPHGGGMDYEIDVPEAGVFQVDVGLAAIQGRQRRHPSGVSFSVAVSTGGSFETLATLAAEQGPRLRSGQGGWTPMTVDLAAYSGTRITLRLAVTPERRFRRRELAWWGSPRVVSLAR